MEAETEAAENAEEEAEVGVRVTNNSLAAGDVDAVVDSNAVGAISGLESAA